MVNRSLPALVTSPGVRATPVVGVVTSMIVPGEPFSLPLVVALVMIIGGIARGRLSDASILRHEECGTIVAMLLTSHARTRRMLRGNVGRTQLRRVCIMHIQVRLISHLGRLVIAVAVLVAGAVPAGAADPTDAIMLVATPALTDPLYGATVLVARPAGGGQFIGFIINKPTPITVAEAFPKHVPSQKVTAPIFLGGPENARTLFALVHREQSPGQGSIQLMPDLFVVLAGATVDQVIEHDPEHARFLVGAVLWQPGELESEIQRGAWYVEAPETDLMMREETGKLWEELVQRLEGRRKAI